MIELVSITADRLAEAMTLRSTDQSTLARELGVTQGAISKIVVGKTANSRLLPRIAVHLDVPLEWLLGQQDDLAAASDEFSRVERDWVFALRAIGTEERTALLTLARSLSFGEGKELRPTLHDKRQAYRGEEPRNGTEG